MNDRELRAVAFGIITYCSICQTGEPPRLDAEDQIILATAYLDNEIFEKTLEICSYANLDDIELAEEDDDE